MLGIYDAVVAGGGVAGVAAARTIAAEGWRVAIIEPTGTLGREIVRARNLFVRLSRYAGMSPTIAEFYECLRQRKGWFDGVVDPNVAALAFDDLMSRYRVQVLFHVWPSNLLKEGQVVTGIEAATKGGYVRMKTPRVLDASVSGKLGKFWFESRPNDKKGSVLHLIYNGVTGECPSERLFLMPEIGDMKVICRPTHWKSEWRISLILEINATRAEWFGLLVDLLPRLQDEITELKNGVLAYVADDVWNVPDLRISTNSKDDHIVGYLEDTAGKPFALRQRMLGDPAIIDGLTLAGTWLDGLPFDLCQEETSIVNAFRLGDFVGASLTRQKT